MMNRLRRLLLVPLAVALPATATTVYKCTGTDGAVVYQDEPCAKSQRQQPVHLSDAQPSPPSPPPAEVAAPPPPEIPATPPAPAPTAMLPVVYGCVRATDGKAYLSDNGNPPAYQAPFGMLGAVQAPLAEVYGHGGGASAPELNRGKVTRALVANNYVWVQDRCRELTPQETCHALRDAYDANERKLHQAFKSERAPFEKREAELQAQLGNC